MVRNKLLLCAQKQNLKIVDTGPTIILFFVFRRDKIVLKTKTNNNFK